MKPLRLPFAITANSNYSYKAEVQLKCGKVAFWPESELRNRAEARRSYSVRMSGYWPEVVV